MKNAQQWFAEYGESHQNPTNKLIHWVCVPAIFFSVIGLLTSLPSDALKPTFTSIPNEWINWGSLVIFLGLFFYLTMSLTIFIGMTVISFLVLLGNIWLAVNLPIPLWLFSVTLFVIAWIGQFIGHGIEGKKPSFLKDLLFLLVGPAWLLGFVYKRLGIPY